MTAVIQPVSASSLNAFHAASAIEPLGLHARSKSTQAQIVDLARDMGVECFARPVVLHHHFPLREGEVLVVSVETLPTGDKIELIRPRMLADLGDVHPVAFGVDGTSGALQAFKVLAGHKELTEAEASFLVKARDLIVAAGQTDDIALVGYSVVEAPKIEVEIPAYRAVVAFPLRFVGTLITDHQLTDGMGLIDVASGKMFHTKRQGSSKHTAWESKGEPNPVTVAIFPILQAEQGVVDDEADAE